MKNDPSALVQEARLTKDGLHFVTCGTGSPLLLLHGSLCDYRYWRWQLPALGEAHTVIAPSLRGYWPEMYEHEDPRFSVTQHATDIVGLISRVGQGRPVHVLGHSRGARVALEVALRAPNIVRSITLADPGFRFEHEPQVPTFTADVAALLNQGETEAALAAFVDGANGGDTWRRMVGWFKTMARDNAGTLFSQIIEVQPDVTRHDLARLHMPAFLVGGANSLNRYVSRLDILQDTVPHATRLTIPLAAHGMNLANPKAFNNGVADFLRAVEDGAPL